MKCPDRTRNILLDLLVIDRKEGREEEMREEKRGRMNEGRKGRRKEGRKDGRTEGGKGMNGVVRKGGEFWLRSQKCISFDNRTKCVPITPFHILRRHYHRHTLHSFFFLETFPCFHFIIYVLFMLPHSSLITLSLLTIILM
ncbi:hypothetical protein LOAG_09954, partial [Loa loa]